MPVEAEFAETVLPHEPALLAAAIALCGGSRDEAHDLVQDTLERALRSFATCPPRTAVRSWLVAIAHNLFIDRCRRARRSPRMVELDAADGLAEPVTDDSPPWAAIGPAELRAAVERLDREFREVFVLFELERRSYDDISARLGLPKATVGTRLARARRKLRAILQEEP